MAYVRAGNFDAINESSEMSVIFLLIGVSLLLATGFLLAFIWSVKQGQYDDDYTPSVRILLDEEKETASAKTTSK